MLFIWYTLVKSTIKQKQLFSFALNNFYFISLILKNVRLEKSLTNYFILVLLTLNLVCIDFDSFLQYVLVWSQFSVSNIVEM